MTKLSRNWFPQWSGDENEVLYEVQGWPTDMVVYLGSRTCTCRFWQLTVKIKPGRPTINRREDKDEQPYNPIRCLYCGEVGHNRRTCKVKKQEEAAEQARLMQLQLAVVATPADANA
ncbi:hypothetical protein Ahy_B05g076061 [Arachis hypogaea]|uniref:CCHC-type domain-containing protein n=1 Tax=Arachis hypogaea TaxID=3818 RepID=A0A444Z2K1_ARAHY|nr:hypothetical protein Ahy_B05g076061 [Arachis hypogaea]